MAEWGFQIGSMWFNAVDIAIVVLALLGAITGVVRGFSIEFSARAGFLIGLVVALFFAKTGSAIIVDTFSLPLFWSTLIAFIVLFIIGFLLTMAVGKMLDKALDALSLDWLDRLLGFFLGMAEVIVVISAIVYVLELQQVSDLGPYLDPSFFAEKLLRPIAKMGTALVKEIL